MEIAVEVGFSFLPVHCSSSSSCSKDGRELSDLKKVPAYSTLQFPASCPTEILRGSPSAARDCPDSGPWKFLLVPLLSLKRSVLRRLPHSL